LPFEVRSAQSTYLPPRSTLAMLSIDQDAY
jgi:hypothetical protein